MKNHYFYQFFFICTACFDNSMYGR